MLHGMYRIALAAGMAALIENALAQGLPDIDIEAHCANVGGGDKRVAACIANESQSRLWLQKHRIDPRILYQCSQTLDLVSAGYVLFRGCVLAKHRG